MGLIVVWMLGTLASYRLWRLLALDDLPGVAEARDRLDAWATTPTRQRYADAVRCSWCLGWWCCVLVFLAIQLLDPYTTPALLVVQIAAASTVVGLIGGKVDG